MSKCFKVCIQHFYAYVYICNLYFVKFVEFHYREVIVSHELESDMQRLKKFFFGIADGLRYIHSQNIIHRDLKPDNIFLTDNDTIKIGDFGLATTRKSSSTIRCGTKYYMAPEIGKTRVTARADMYSFGIILFEMCYPMMRSNRTNVLKKIRQIGSPIEDYLFNHQFYNVRMINIFYTKY